MNQAPSARRHFLCSVFVAAPLGRHHLWRRNGGPVNLVAYFPVQQRWHRNSGPSDGTAPCLPAVTAPVLGLALMGTLPPASQWRRSDLQQEAPRLPAICAGGTAGSQRPPFLAHLVSPFSVSFLSTSERAAEIPLSPCLLERDGR